MRGSTRNSRWAIAGMSNELANWQGLRDDEGSRRPGEALPEPLDWALAWSVAGLDFEQARRWCELRLPLVDLPVLAAVATRHRVSHWLVDAWVDLGARLKAGDIPVIGALEQEGWIIPALRLVATAGALGPARVPDLLERLLDLPPHAVLAGARCGLDLGAAVELAEYGRAGGATEQLLHRLMRERAVSDELGARINVAITDIGDAIPPGLWATPASSDARVTRSVHASLPKDLWEQFFSGYEQQPEAPEVDEEASLDPDSWTRDDNSWTLIDPPEDRALQPTMSWSAAHQIDALRRYLDAYLRYLNHNDWVELSWPPAAYLTTDGAWSYSSLAECDEHGTGWNDECDDCAAARDAWDQDDGVRVYQEAEWDWHVQVQTTRSTEDGEDVDVDSWLYITTTMDPREVRYR